jgi:hypothetical protein
MSAARARTRTREEGAFSDAAARFVADACARRPERPLVVGRRRSASQRGHQKSVAPTGPSKPLATINRLCPIGARAATSRRGGAARPLSLSVTVRRRCPPLDASHRRRPTGPDANETDGRVLTRFAAAVTEAARRAQQQLTSKLAGGGALTPKCWRVAWGAEIGRPVPCLSCTQDDDRACPLSWPAAATARKRCHLLSLSSSLLLLPLQPSGRLLIRAAYCTAPGD